MKKALQASLMALLVAFAITSCAPGTTQSRPEGWVDDDTFRVRVTGYAPEGSERKWKAEAKTAAEIVAAETIMRKMIGSYLESTGATENNELIGKVVKEKAAGTIIGYQIVEVIYDDNGKSADIIAEMKSAGLRKLMDQRIKQYFEEIKKGGIGPQERK